MYDFVLGLSELFVVNGNVDIFFILDNIIYDMDNIGIDLIGYEEIFVDDKYDWVWNGIVRGNEVYDIIFNYNFFYGINFLNDSYLVGGIYVDGGIDYMID